MRVTMLRISSSRVDGSRRRSYAALMLGASRPGGARVTGRELDGRPIAHRGQTDGGRIVARSASYARPPAPCAGRSPLPPSQAPESEPAEDQARGRAAQPPPSRAVPPISIQRGRRLREGRADQLCEDSLDQIAVAPIFATISPGKRDEEERVVAEPELCARRRARCTSAVAAVSMPPTRIIAPVMWMRSGKFQLSGRNATRSLAPGFQIMSIEDQDDRDGRDRVQQSPLRRPVEREQLGARRRSARRPRAPRPSSSPRLYSAPERRPSRRRSPRGRSLRSPSRSTPRRASSPIASQIPKTIVPIATVPITRLRPPTPATARWRRSAGNVHVPRRDDQDPEENERAHERKRAQEVQREKPAGRMSWRESWSGSL